MRARTPPRSATIATRPAAARAAIVLKVRPSRSARSTAAASASGIAAERGVELDADLRRREQRLVAGHPQADPRAIESALAAEPRMGVDAG